MTAPGAPWGSGQLQRAGLHGAPEPPASPKRFPDGAAFRVEIPSVEGATVLAAVLEEAARCGITVNRVSQGSGAMLLGDEELADMARLGADHGVEVALFTGPRAEWGLSAVARAQGAPLHLGTLRGSRDLRFALEDVARAAEAGIRSFLVADLGLLKLLATARERGDLPGETVLKVSVLLAPSNAASLRILEDLGADTVNLPTDTTVTELAELRTVTDLPLDLYVEAPDAMGGFVRGHEVAELVAVGAPLYVKYGLRNSAALYPSGAHLEEQASVIAWEKVRRARTSLQWLARSGLDLGQSGPGAAGLGVPARTPAAHGA